MDVRTDAGGVDSRRPARSGAHARRRRPLGSIPRKAFTRA
jgi:hypothetical protein